MFPVGAGPVQISSVAASSNGQTVYTFTTTVANLPSGAYSAQPIPNGGVNLFQGLLAYIVGFTKNGGINNSGQSGFKVVSNLATTMTVVNSNGVSETGVGYAFFFQVNAAGPYVLPEGPFGQGPATNVTGGGWPYMDCVAGISDVPDAPSGVNLVNYFNSWNYTNSETSTQSKLTALTAARNNQTPWTAVNGFNPPSPPGLNVAQTTPSAPTGTYTQSGSAYNTNASSCLLAGVRASDFAYYAGVNGAKG